MAARGSAVTAIGADEFAGLMSPLGPFEQSPELAVAVSGGADSVALCLLAEEWAHRHSGRAIAVIVDHGLRPGSAEEARGVSGRLDARGIATAVLRWEDAKPASDVQAAARAARYGLLTGWCRDAGVLHLLLAHHRDDQAETVLLRLGRGSGVDGLAAMAVIVETPAVRILRPLLDIPKARLRATLRARGEPWVEDPSNVDPAFARTHLRMQAPAFAAAGLTARRLAGMAHALGRARSALEVSVSELLAVTVSVHPAGFCRVDPEPFRAAPDAVARRALVRVLLCIGGGIYPPRGARLERLHVALRDGGLARGRTLAGCRILPHREGLLFCREAAAAKTEMTLESGTSSMWDGRFLVRAECPGGAISGQYRVRRLGRAGWTAVAAAGTGLRKTSVPGAVRPGLPAFFDLDGVAAVPHLGYVRTAFRGPRRRVFTAEFRPAQALGPPTFALAAPERYNESQKVASGACRSS